MKPTPEQLACKHTGRHFANVTVTVIVDKEPLRTVEIEVECGECHWPMQFDNVPHAILLDRPCTNIDSTTLSVPAVPFGSPPLNWKDGEFRGLTVTKTVKNPDHN